MSSQAPPTHLVLTNHLRLYTRVHGLLGGYARVAREVDPLPGSAPETLGIQQGEAHTEAGISSLTVGSEPETDYFLHNLLGHSLQSQGATPPPPPEWTTKKYREGCVFGFGDGVYEVKQATQRAI